MEGARGILRTERQLAKRENRENEEGWKGKSGFKWEEVENGRKLVECV